MNNQNRSKLEKEIRQYLVKANVNKHDSNTLIEMVMIKFNVSYEDARSAFVRFIS